MATEDSMSAVLGTTTSGIPISHLDYGYVRKCTNGAELEKILKVLRSGEEGMYPELIEFTEKRLADIHPKSKALHKEIQIQSYNDLDMPEREQVSGDFENWFSEINQKDSLLKENSEKGQSNSDFLPPIRSAKTVGSTTTGSAQVSNGSGREGKKGSVMPKEYKDWDKYNPEEEIKAMEEKEEKELKIKREKVGINCKDAELPDTVETTGKTDEELKVLAEYEKNKGNEAFRSGDYKESLVYYSRSIQLKPSAAAYNNKAFAELKLEKYDDAIQDCNMVISLEPNNLKAFLRRAIAYKRKGDSFKARQDLKQVLEIEPNNKRAKELLGEVDEEKSNHINSHVHVDTNSKKIGKRMKIIEIENEEEMNNDKEDGNNVDKKPPESLLTYSDSCITDETTSKSTKHVNLTSVVTSEKVTKGEQEANSIQTEEINSKVNAPESKEIAEIGHKEVIVSESQPPGEPEPERELPCVVVKAKDEGTSLFKLGRYAEAAEEFTTAVEILEKDKIQFKSALASLLYNRAACLNKMGDALGCVKDCNASLELIPGSAKALVKRAASQEMLERFKLSYLDYESALCIDSTNKQAQEGRSRVAKHLINIHGTEWRYKLKDIKSPTTPVSSELLNTEKTTTLTPSPLNIASNAINNSQMKPVKDSATKSMEEKLTPPPKRSKDEKFEQSKDRGNAFVKQGKLEEAVSCYSVCIQLDPDKVVSYTNRALCFLRLNKYEQAVDDTSKALDLQPGNVKALYRRALAKKGLREYDSAAKDLLDLSKIDPTNTAGKKELDVILNLCREDRREKQKSADTKKDTKQCNISKVEPTNQKGKPKQTPRRRRVQIEEVNGEEDSHDECNAKTPSSSKISQDSCPPKITKSTSQPSAKPSTPKSTIDQPANKPSASKNTVNHPTVKPSTTNKPENNKSKKSTKKRNTKLKTNPFDFYQAWNSVKQDDYAGYADILRQIQPVFLPKVLSNKLDADMIRNIVRAVYENILAKGEEKFSFEILQYVCKAERFEMALMFLDSQDNKVLSDLFSKLESARAKKTFVNMDAFNDVLSKYKVKSKDL